MNSRSLLKNASLFILIYIVPLHLQIIAEVDVPELQLLASNLKPEECVKLVSLDSGASLSEAQIEKMAREQSCFRRLVKWICQLRTVTKNTYPIVNSLLERVGRRDLITCLVDLNMKTFNSPKVVRDVQAVDDSEDYEGVTAVPSTKSQSDQKGPQTEQKASTPYSNHTIDTLIGHTISVSLKTVGIIITSTILVTCCCTLFIRNRIASLINRIRGKKKKGKFIPIEEDVGGVSRSYFVRKPRVKRKRAPSYELVHAETQQDNIIAVAREAEEPQPTGCYKCYKKKRKKSTRKPHR